MKPTREEVRQAFEAKYAEIFPVTMFISYNKFALDSGGDYIDPCVYGAWSMYEALQARASNECGSVPHEYPKISAMLASGTGGFLNAEKFPQVFEQLGMQPPNNQPDSDHVAVISAKPDSVHLAVNLDEPESSVGDKYVEAEKRLAELLSGKEVHVDGETGSVWLAREVGLWGHDFPQWTRDNGPAFALMVKHGCYPFETAHEAIAVEWYFTDEYPLHDDATAPVVSISSHPSKEAAVRFAIAKAVIAKLESGISSPTYRPNEKGVVGEGKQ